MNIFNTAASHYNSALANNGLKDKIYNYSVTISCIKKFLYLSPLSI